MDDFFFTTTLREVLFLIVRWSHIVSAVIWVGGSAFMALVISPVRGANPSFDEAFTATGIRFRHLINIVVSLLAVSGILLMVERIFISSVPPVWFVLLGVKVALGAWMLYIIWHRRNVKLAGAPSNRILAKLSWLLGYNALIAFGVLAILLASIMQRVFEIFST